MGSPSSNLVFETELQKRVREGELKRVIGGSGGTLTITDGGGRK